ncbi:MAG TPA: sugar ABC transporter substrate-binding protein [Baekduia sp.]|nr:sugar ABC transporter substrate-binding protein [Baekduia sp.]
MSQTMIRKLVAVLAALCLTLGVAACGSDNDSGTENSSGATAETSGNNAEAAAVVEKAKTPPTWQGPKDSPPPAKDKFVIDIPCTQAAIGCKRPGDAFLEAAKVMGWKTQLIDPAGDPKKVQSAMRQAISLGADAVFVTGTPLSAFSGVVPALKKAGVKLISMSGTEAKPKDPNGWDAVINNDYVLDTPPIAAYIATHSGGKANVLLINDSEFPQVDHGIQSMKTDLAKYCPDCKVAGEMDFSIVDIATTFPTRVKAELQAHPDVDWVYAPYDFAGTFVATAIKQMGKAGKIKVVGIDGNPQNIQNIKDGVQAVTVARSTEWVGWAAVDQVNRIFQGQPTVDDADGYQGEGYARKLIDKDNLPADVAAPWTGDVDFRSEYRKIWGIK